MIKMKMMKGLPIKMVMKMRLQMRLVSRLMFMPHKNFRTALVNLGKKLAGFDDSFPSGNFVTSYLQNQKSYQTQILHQECFYEYNDSNKDQCQSIGVNFDFLHPDIIYFLA